MTEFETAQLAIMNAELVNSSIGNFQSQTEIMYQQIALGHSLLFGYLLAAYFIGAALTAYSGEREHFFWTNVNT